MSKVYYLMQLAKAVFQNKKEEEKEALVQLKKVGYTEEEIYQLFEDIFIKKTKGDVDHHETC